MKTYTIKNTDIMHKGKIFPEGSSIDLDEKDAEILSAYLVQLDADRTKKLELEPKLEHKKRSK